MATGAVVGGLLGAAALAIATMSGLLYFARTIDAEILLAGAKAGALAGVVLAPVAAWTLMRSVPLWRAIGEPGIGTALGSVLGTVVGRYTDFGLSASILGGLIGFLVAAVRLRFFYRKPKVESAEPVA